MLGARRRAARRRSTAIKPGNGAVVWAGSTRCSSTSRALRAAGTEIAAVVAARRRRRARPSCRRACARSSARSCEAHGKKRVKAVSVRYTGGTEKIACDLLCLSARASRRRRTCCARARHAGARGRRPARSGAASAESVAHAREVGARAARGEGAELPELGQKARRCGDDGYVCLCEDVSVQDVEQRRRRGLRARPSCSSATRRSRWARARAGSAPASCARSPSASRPAPSARISAPTTARPPARAGHARARSSPAPSHHLERRTALHDDAPRGSARRSCGPASGSASRHTTATIERRVPGGARGRRPDRRRHARQVPRRRARRRRVPGAPLPDPRRRPRGRAACATACCSRRAA